MTSVSSSGIRWQGKPQSDRRALVRHTLDGDRATVQIHNGLDDGKSQSHPWVAVRACRVNSIETVENLWEMFGCNAHTRVTDPDHDGVVIRRCDRQGHLATARGVVQRIREQIAHGTSK